MSKVHGVAVPEAEIAALVFSMVLVEYSYEPLDNGLNSL